MAADAPRYRKRIITITATGATTVGRVGIGGTKYARLMGLRGLITSGTDTSTTITVADALGKVLMVTPSTDFTVAKNIFFNQDDTSPGTGITLQDASGAAAAAGQLFNIVAEGPFTVTWGTATTGEKIRVELYMEV